MKLKDLYENLQLNKSDDYSENRHNYYHISYGNKKYMVYELPREYSFKFTKIQSGTELHRITCHNSDGKFRENFINLMEYYTSVNEEVDDNNNNRKSLKILHTNFMGYSDWRIPCIDEMNMFDGVEHTIIGIDYISYFNRNNRTIITFKMYDNINYNRAIEKTDDIEYRLKYLIREVL